MQIGSIVISKAGRDRYQYFIVVGIEEEYVYLVDGDMRKIEKPKKKKIKHVEVTSMFEENIASKVIKKNKITNQDVKKAIKAMIK